MKILFTSFHHLLHTQESPANWLILDYKCWQPSSLPLFTAVFLGGFQCIWLAMEGKDFTVITPNTSQQCKLTHLTSVMLDTIFQMIILFSDLHPMHPQANACQTLHLKSHQVSPRLLTHSPQILSVLGTLLKAKDLNDFIIITWNTSWLLASSP